MLNRCFYNKNDSGEITGLKLLAHVFIWISIPLTLWGCSDNSADPGDLLGALNPGSFEASVTGSESQNFSGISVFATQQLGPPTGNIFGLSLSSITNNPNYSVTITFRDSNRPNTGVHTIESQNSDRAGQFVVMISQDEFRTYRSTSGEMTISQSTTESLQGELTFNAELFNDPDSKVTVTARFNANCQQASFLTCE